MGASAAQNGLQMARVASKIEIRSSCSIVLMLDWLRCIKSLQPAAVCENISHIASCCQKSRKLLPSGRNDSSNRHHLAKAGLGHCHGYCRVMPETPMIKLVGAALTPHHAFRLKKCIAEGMKGRPFLQRGQAKGNTQLS